MTLWGYERKRGRRKGLIKLSESACISLSLARCAPDALLVVLVLINVSIISQHVYCISIDVFNLRLTQNPTSYVSSLLTTEADELWRNNTVEKIILFRKSTAFAKMCFVSL